jgi:hypothetical protein
MANFDSITDEPNHTEIVNSQFFADVLRFIANHNDVQVGSAKALVIVMGAIEAADADFLLALEEATATYIGTGVD